VLAGRPDVALRGRHEGDQPAHRAGALRADTGAFIGLVIKPNGSVGYVLGQQLFRIDSRGSALLDEGAGIDSASLAVNRTRLYWLHDNIPQSAALR